MPLQTNFHLARYADGVLTINLAPPTAIGGWGIQFQMTRYFGSDDILIEKSVASGFNNLSGINITNSGAGVFNVNFSQVESSGLDPGNYAYQILRVDSGLHNILCQGYRVMNL